MRRAVGLVAALLAPACGDGASVPQAARETPTAEAPSRPDGATPALGPPPQAASGTGPGSALSGHTSGLTGTVSDFAVERTDFGTRVLLAADTLFEFDKATLTLAAEANLLRMAELVRQGGEGTVTITGHTDSKGDDAYNLDLSKRRAEAVAEWLRGQPGMNARMLAVEGRGEAEPVAPNITPNGADDPEGRAQNRRVTIDIPL